jgi:hypothetical protein
MFTKKLSSPLVLASLLALSLSNVPAAHAEGFVSKVKGAFVATGDAIKDTAKATGNVIRGGAKATGDVIVGSAKATGGVLKDSAKVTEDVLKGTAKAGEAACVATGDAIKGSAKATGAACVATGGVIKESAKATGAACAATGRAVGTTTGAIAGATGEAISGSAKAVGNTTGAVVGATEGVLGMHHKPASVTAVTASSVTESSDTNARISSFANSTTTADKPVAMPIPRSVAKAVAKPAFAAPATQEAAPVSLSTEGTRISPPVEGGNESPSWNVQEPVASSTAFAAQYALRTTPLQATTP